MKLPDWAYNRLERLLSAERRRRTADVTRRITYRDRALRAWADTALVAHEAGKCVDRCPFSHPPQHRRV